MKQSELDEALRVKRLEEQTMRMSIADSVKKNYVDTGKTCSNFCIDDNYNLVCTNGTKQVRLTKEEFFQYCINGCTACSEFTKRERQPSTVDADKVATQILQEVEEELPDMFKADFDVSFDTITDKQIAELYDSKMRNATDGFCFISETEAKIWDKLETSEYKLMHQLNKILYVLKSINLKHTENISYLKPSDVKVDLEYEIREVLRGL